MTKKTTHKITIVWGTDREEEKTYSFYNKTERMFCKRCRRE